MSDFEQKNHYNFEKEKAAIYSDNLLLKDAVNSHRDECFWK